MTSTVPTIAGGSCRGLLAGILALGVTACACDPGVPPSSDAAAASSAPLAIGESRTVRIDARDPWNAHGIRLAAGGRYELAVTEVADWRDAWIDADPQTGWLGVWRYVGAPLAWLRRVPEAPWFSLVGVVGDPERGWRCFVIGTGATGYRSATSGPLYLFANDMAGRYGNNRGTLRLRVTRIE